MWTYNIGYQFIKLHEDERNERSLEIDEDHEGVEEMIYVK
jgi:hypothetical protein